MVALRYRVPHPRKAEQLSPQIVDTGSRCEGSPRADGERFRLSSLREPYSPGAESNNILIRRVVRFGWKRTARESTHGYCFPFHWSDLVRLHARGFRCRSHASEGDRMTAWYVVCGVVALLLLVYLFVAMLKPEAFQ